MWYGYKEGTQRFVSGEDICDLSDYNVVRGYLDFQNQTTGIGDLHRPLPEFLKYFAELNA